MKLPNLDSVAGINKLVAIMAKLDTAGRQVILQALSSELSDAKKQQVLSVLRQHVAVTDTAVRGWLIQGIAASYVAGANYTVKSLKAIGFKVPASLGGGLQLITPEILRTAPFMQPHLKVVNTLLSSSYLDFGNSMTGYIRGAEQILNDGLKRQIRSNIAAGRLEGAAIREIKNVVKNTIGDKGFTVLLDRGGKQWSLDRYSEMLARTHINKAANEAIINRCSDFGVDIVEVSSHGGACDACSEIEGKMYSLSGTSDEYPSINEIDFPIHPNCSHILLSRPDITA